MWILLKITGQSDVGDLILDLFCQDVNQWIGHHIDLFLLLKYGSLN